MSSIKLSIAEPCHENWNAMLPEQQGRFCLSCQKTVVDFTNMSDRQVVDYFKNYQGNTCGQFSNHQLDRELTKPKTHSIGRWKYFWQILLPAFFAFQKLDAQPKKVGKVAAIPVCQPVNVKPPHIQMGMVMPAPVKNPIVKPATQIHGSITDDKKMPVAYASITSSDGKHAVADSAGKFSISLGGNASLTISAVGYKEQQFSAESIKPTNITALRFENNHPVVETTIVMEAEQNLIGDVVVVGYNQRVMNVIAGGITMVRSQTLLSDAKVITPKNDLPHIKVFPNPIQPGQDFQVTFQVKKAGNYIMQIIDATGKVLVNERLNLLSINQTETINGNNLQQAGIYFIKLTNPKDKKTAVLSGRIVVQ